MSITSIIVLILLVIGFVAFVVVMQLKEQARLEKLRKIALFNNQMRQIRRYLDDLPAQYQPKDMRLWLYSCLLNNMDALLALQPDDTLLRRRNHLSQEMQEFQDSKAKRKARAISDELQILEIRRLFESFSMFLRQAKEQNLIDSDSVFKYKNLFDFYRYKVSADHKAYLARQAFLTNRFEDAVGFYREAALELENVKEVPEAQEAQKHFVALANEIDSDIQLQKAEAERFAQEDPEEEESLDKEWDQFMNKDGFTKKKYF